MPILLARAKPPYKADEGEPGLWRQGEIVNAVDDGHLFGSQELPSAGNFYHITITDRTLEQVQSYLQAWRHEPDTQQIAAAGDNRTIRVTSSMVSASGQNAFDIDRFQVMLDEINAQYPTANATYSAHTNTTYDFTITAPVEARDQIIERVNEAVRDMQYRRRRWYINQDGRNYLDANGNQATGTVFQLSNYLRDGLLD